MIAPYILPQKLSTFTDIYPNTQGGQGIYTLVELYSENDFYDYDRCKIESDLIVKKKNIYKDGIYYMKFLLKGTDDDVRENL